MGYNTKQRGLILSCIKNISDSHVTADKIAEKLRAGGTPVGLTTVYRHLAALEADGVLRRITTDVGMPACYQLLNGCTGHYHLRCDGCGAVIHAGDGFPEMLGCELKKIYGFTLDASKTMFYGKCFACTKGKDV